MPEFCTCGAQLPPDAVFCHKCGKPQREIVQVETVAPPPPPPPAVPALEPVREFAPVSFRNMEVVKTALIAAVLATFLLFIPYVNWLAAGYFAVFFYRRRTHQPVDIVSGVRIGWLTGLMNFAILAVILTCWILILRTPEALDMAKVMAQKNSQFRELLGVVQNGPQLFGLLATSFVFVTFLSMTGGLLGAVLTRHVNPRPPATLPEKGTENVDPRAPVPISPMEPENVSPLPPAPNPAVGTAKRFAPVSFRNRDAMRTALLAAGLATLLCSLSFYAWTAAGGLAVFLYRRRTGHSMSAAACLRLGWLTGLLAFAIPAVLFTAAVLLLHAFGGMDPLHSLLLSGARSPLSQKDVQWVWETIQSPPKLLRAYVDCFVYAVFFCMAGGLLGGLVMRTLNPRPPGGNTV
jgi:hypothetical protein